MILGKAQLAVNSDIPLTHQDRLLSWKCAFLPHKILKYLTFLSRTEMFLSGCSNIDTKMLNKFIWFGRISDGSWAVTPFSGNPEAGLVPWNMSGIRNLLGVVRSLSRVPEFVATPLFSGLDLENKFYLSKLLLVLGSWRKTHEKLVDGRTTVTVSCNSVCLWISWLAQVLFLIVWLCLRAV